MPDNHRLRQVIQHVEQLLEAIGRLPRKQDQNFCLSQLDLLLEICRKLLVFEAALQQLKPHTLMGCLEFNLYGVLASLFKEQYRYQLINIQHGIVAPTWTLDGLCFDQYLIWNAKTADVILQEDYSHPASLRIVGNPKWEALERLIRHGTPSDEYLKLMKWKGDAPLIGAYTQYIRGYSTQLSKQTYIQALIQYLKNHPDVKLLIKKHPLETDSLVDEWITASGLTDRIRVYNATELPLWELLKAVDLVTSIFSAMLSRIPLFTEKNGCDRF